MRIPRLFLILSSFMALVSCSGDGEEQNDPAKDSNHTSKAKFLVYISWALPYGELRNLYDFGINNTFYDGRGFLTDTPFEETIDEFWFETSSGKRVYVDTDVIYNDMPDVWTPVEIDSAEYVSFGFTTSPVCKTGNVYATDGIITGVSEEISEAVELTGENYMVGRPSKPVMLYDGVTMSTGIQTVFRIDVIINAVSSNTTRDNPDSPFQGASVIVEKTLTYSLESYVLHVNAL